MRAAHRSPRRAVVLMRTKSPAALAHARERSPFTQVELARVVGCTQQYISALETRPGKNCDQDIAARICRFLGVTLEDYFEPAAAVSSDTGATPSRVTGRAS